MGKSTISMAIFNSYVTNYQRVPPVIKHGGPWSYKTLFVDDFPAGRGVIKPYL